MRRAIARLRHDRRGAVAPTVALSLFALIGAGGLAFDYARMASLDSELQNAADQAALAAASQLDRSSGSMERASAAAQNLVTNLTLMANDNNVSNRTVTVPTVMFYELKADAENNVNGFNDTTQYARARFVRVAVGARRANYALTPVVGALSSGDMSGEAVAGIGSAICKVPPVMLCNPDEPSTNNNELLPYAAVPGVGLRLVTGNATVPGNFGWLESGIGNGAGALAAALGYNNPPGDCQAITGVTTKTGMDTAVLNAFNTRFDVFANGNMTCPNQLGGTCSPSVNTRKDVVCDPNNAVTSCQSAGWSEAANPYRPLKEDDGTGTGTLVEVPKVLPTNGSQDPSIMGYPRDLCHATKRNAQTCGIKGSGIWDRDAYFRVNYGQATTTAWRNMMSLAAGAAAPTRYQVYQWEMLNRTVSVGGTNYGIDHPQFLTNTAAAFSYPATGTPGAPVSSTQPDRRKISAAVLNCQALNAKGKTTDVPVPTWLEVFLVEPALNRGSGSNLYTDQKDIYVETIGITTQSSNSAGQVVRRDVPYLIK